MEYDIATAILCRGGYGKYGDKVRSYGEFRDKNGVRFRVTRIADAEEPFYRGRDNILPGDSIEIMTDAEVREIMALAEC